MIIMNRNNDANRNDNGDHDNINDSNNFSFFFDLTNFVFIYGCRAKFKYLVCFKLDEEKIL